MMKEKGRGFLTMKMGTKSIILVKKITVKGMKGSGKIVKCTAKEFLPGLMAK